MATLDLIIRVALAAAVALLAAPLDVRARQPTNVRGSDGWEAIRLNIL